MTRQSIPNLLTALRIVFGVLVFVILAAAKAHDEGISRAAAMLAFSLYVAGALTDFLDGWLARRWKVESIWGAILDPIADKIAVVAAVLGVLLLEPRVMIAAPGFLILSRELFVSGLREVAAGRGVRFPVTKLAKWKTTVQLVALSLAILCLGIGAGWWWGAVEALLWLAAGLTLWTGWVYAAAARRQLR